MAPYYAQAVFFAHSAQAVHPECRKATRASGPVADKSVCPPEGAHLSTNAQCSRCGHSCLLSTPGGAEGPAPLPTLSAQSKTPVHSGPPEVDHMIADKSVRPPLQAPAMRLAHLVSTLQFNDSCPFVWIRGFLIPSKRARRARPTDEYCILTPECCLLLPIER